MIVAASLTKRFGSRTAVDGVSFDVRPGEVVGFLGANGAGKTTTLRLLAGVFPPSSGHAAVDGHDLATAPLAARRHLGYAPERPALHGEMTVRAQLAYAAGLRECADPAGAVEDALTATRLHDLAERRIGTLSKGMKQRVGLAVALVGKPPALLLDEPLAGLDPAQSREMRDRIRALADAGHAVLLSSHALADVELIADRVVILHDGHVLAVDRPAALARRLRPAACFDVEVEIATGVEAVERVLRETPGVARVERLPADGNHVRVRVYGPTDADLRPLIAARLIDAGGALLGLAPVETTLEEAFLQLVGGEPTA